MTSLQFAHYMKPIMWPNEHIWLQVRVSENGLQRAPVRVRSRAVRRVSGKTPAEKRAWEQHTDHR